MPDGLMAYGDYVYTLSSASLLKGDLFLLLGMRSQLLVPMAFRKALVCQTS